MNQDAIDARRYRWLREAGAWESEIGMDSMTPEQFDARVDAEMGVDPRYTITPAGRAILEGVTPYQAQLNNPLVKRRGCDE